MSLRSAALAFAILEYGVSGVARADTAAAPGVATSQIISLLAAMILVVAAIVAVAWLLKRFSPRGFRDAGILRIVAGTAVGQRERVMVIEIGTRWLVIGVAPGRVSMLQEVPPVASTPESAPATPAAGNFAAWLKQKIEQRDAR
jgi:flagellar protein FliO/FliZ